MSRSKESIKTTLTTAILKIHDRCNEVKKSINENLEDTLDYLETLIAQIPQSTSGPLIAKTPKVLRKKEVKRIETIHEDEVFDTDCTLSDSVSVQIKLEENQTEEATVQRSRRLASRKAANNIRKQQNEYNNDNTVKKPRESRSKRKKLARSSSEEEEEGKNKIPRKYSKMEESILNKDILQNGIKIDTDNVVISNNNDDVKCKEENTHKRNTRCSSRKKLSTSNEKTENKAVNVIDDTLIAPVVDDAEEPSIYEDANGKPIPIMNSTMKHNSTIVLDKGLNVTVVLERLSKQTKLNETVTIKEKSNLLHKTEDKNNEELTDYHDNIHHKKEPHLPHVSKIVSSQKALQDRMHQLKAAMANKEFDALITDDESSPEVKKQRTKKLEVTKKQKVISTSSSEDEILCTPSKTILREANTGAIIQEIKNSYKTNALFSPYAKESVKKRVEAFEQASMNSPKPVDIDAPTRMTRTKTRALNAAQGENTDNTAVANKNVAKKLARKSLAKAKKISLAKQLKNSEESKENKVRSAQKISKLIVPDKLSQKQQLKTTPVGKTRVPLPMSVNRIQQTPNNTSSLANYTKTLTASRTNIVTSMESFIQAPKSICKSNSSENIEEKKWKVNEEDARRKREEALKLQTEEKRRKRQEKELKNKLAREAKEKQEMEKRLKAEKEREEKAKLAQQMLEKQREELEKKRLAQLQRAQEKEEKRRLEEQQRLQRLQEQEEAERLLAEQRRREQEAERRREAEARAQQQAAIEAMRMKTQVMAAQMKAKQMHANKQHGPTNYVLDSEPDDDESDDESRPKHAIPYWAQMHVRKAKLAMQRYIPEKAIFKFFDTRKCTPDLTELFNGIDRSRLKRTSSAIWKTPPRYSMMEAE